MFSKDIGIDLGTANTLVCLRGRGIILREPSVVAVDTRNDSVLAVGAQAKEMIGRTPESIMAVRPLRDGVIADFAVTARMIRHFIKCSVRPSLFSKPRVVICMPTGVTEVERRAVEDAAYRAGARAPGTLIEEPMAAAVCMVVDIGGGTTEVAVISLGDIVTACSVRVGGDRFDEAIAAYIKKRYSLLVGERTAEDVKLKIGTAFPCGEEEEMTIKGRNLLDGLPKDLTVSSKEIREAISEPLAAITDAIRTTLEQTPPELSADIIDRGIMLTGGGALLRGMDMLVMQQTGMPVHIAERPLDCVADGAEKRLGKR